MEYVQKEITQLARKLVIIICNFQLPLHQGQAPYEQQVGHY